MEGNFQLASVLLQSLGDQRNGRSEGSGQGGLHAEAHQQECRNAIYYCRVCYSIEMNFEYAANLP
jgi:hypothetical protein